MMIQLNKLTITLALLMTAATGAWADVDPTVTPTTNKNEWQFAMPKGNVLLMVTYKDRTQTAVTYGNEAIPAEGVTAYLGFEAEFAKKLVATAMNRENIWAFPVTNAESFTYESNYTGAETDVIAFRDGDNGYKAKGALTDIVFLREGTATLTVRFKGDDDLSRSRVRLTVKVEQKPYLLDLADGTADAGGWQGKAGTATSYGPLPLTDVKKDQPVELKYDGRLKVKSVSARVVPTVDLALLSADDLEDDYQTYIVPDGAMLTGKLDGEKQPYKIVIPDGATVTLNGVNIDGSFHANNFMNYQWAGITCAGNATIILKSINSVTGFFGNYPGIQAGPSGTTLTIRGNGTLTAASNGYGTGIGSEYHGIGCGDITILGGNITANGGSGSAGIGSANTSGCGNITITDGVTRVKATKGDEAPNSIGAGKNSTCGNVTIGCTLDSDGHPVGGKVYWDGSDYQSDGDTYLQQATITYQPSN